MNTDSTAMPDDALMPASAIAPSNKQRLFMRYFTAILIDLVVLNLFVEYLLGLPPEIFAPSLGVFVVDGGGERAPDRDDVQSRGGALGEIYRYLSCLMRVRRTVGGQ